MPGRKIFYLKIPLRRQERTFGAEHFLRSSMRANANSKEVAEKAGHSALLKILKSVSTQPIIPIKASNFEAAVKISTNLKVSQKFGSENDKIQFEERTRLAIVEKSLKNQVSNSGN